MKNRRTIFAAMAAVGAMAMCAAALAQTEQQTTTTKTTTQTNPPSQTTTTTTQTTTTIPDMSTHFGVSDQIFMMHLIHANALEIEMSKIAMKQANTRAVYDYANMIYNDHNSLQSQLMGTYGSAPWLTDWQNTLRHNPTNNAVGMAYYQSTNYMSVATTTNNLNQTAGTTMPGQTSNQNTYSGGSSSMNGNWDNYWYLDATDWDRMHHIESLNGFAFDKEYSAEMVRGHRALMGEIWAANENSMNTDVKNLISSIQPTVQRHLDEGRRLSFMFDDPFHFDRPLPWTH